MRLYYQDACDSLPGGYKGEVGLAENVWSTSTPSTQRRRDSAFTEMEYRIAGKFCGDLNWRIFFTKSPKLIPPNTRARVRVIARIIVRNGVACGTHVFAKLEFASNILDQFAALMPAKLTGYTVSLVAGWQKWFRYSYYYYMLTLWEVLPCSYMKRPCHNRLSRSEARVHLQASNFYYCFLGLS